MIISLQVIESMRARCKELDIDEADLIPPARMGEMLTGKALWVTLERYCSQCQKPHLEIHILKPTKLPLCELFPVKS